jgi:hypothetical protein
VIPQVLRAPGKVVAIAASDRRDSPQAASRRRIDELFEEQAPQVARLAYRLLGRDDEVDDIVQDVFMTLFRNLDRIRQTGAIGRGCRPPPCASRADPCGCGASASCCGFAIAWIRSCSSARARRARIAPRCGTCTLP